MTSLCAALLGASLPLAANPSIDTGGPSPVIAAILDALPEEQAASLGTNPMLQDAAAAVPPQARAAARANLAKLEGKASPKLLTEITHAYSLLADSSAALGAAQRLRRISPGPGSEAHYALTLARAGDYEAAYALALQLQAQYPGRKDVSELLAYTRGRRAGGGVTGQTSVPFAVNDGAAAVTSDFKDPPASERPDVKFLTAQIRKAREADAQDVAMGLAGEMMRLTPSSQYAQEVHNIVARDYERWGRIRTATGYVENAKKALAAGRDKEALDWAMRAQKTLPEEPQSARFLGQVQEVVRNREGENIRIDLDARKHKKRKHGVPWWPTLPAFGLGSLAYAVTKSRKTVESEDGYDEDNPPQFGRGQQFVGGAILAGIAGAALYVAGATAVVHGPSILQALRGPGQQAMRLAQSETGAVNPSAVEQIKNASPEIRAAAESSAVRWGPLNGPGPLQEQVAATFRGGSYNQIVLAEETTLYRAYGGNASRIGPYWTRTPPTGPLQSTIDSALNPAWGNTARNATKIKVPAGTTIYEGFAAPQGGLVGGGNQVYLKPGTLQSSWLEP